MMNQRKWGDKMLFNEWIKGNSLFTEINKIKPFSFITSHGVDNLDLIYKMTYGSKQVPKSIEDLTVTDLANIIVTTYGENWNKKYELLTNEILLGVDYRTIVSETISDDMIKNVSGSSTSKVSAYNDDELSTNDSNDDSMNEDSQKELNRNNETTKTSFNVAKSQLELFNSNFINIVCKDISKIVSLSIY